MDVVLLVIAGLTGIAVVVALAVLIRREVRFRRLSSWSDPARHDPRAVDAAKTDAESSGYSAQIMRGTGGIP